MTAADMTTLIRLRPAGAPPRHFLDLDAMATSDLRAMLDFAHALKARRRAGMTSRWSVRSVGATR